MHEAVVEGLGAGLLRNQRSSGCDSFSITCKDVSVTSTQIASLGLKQVQVLRMFLCTALLPHPLLPPPQVERKVLCF